VIHLCYNRMTVNIVYYLINSFNIS